MSLRLKARPWLVVVAVTVIAGASAIHGEFIEDDNPNVELTQWIKSLRNIGDVWSMGPTAALPGLPHYRPIVGTTLIIDYALWGPNPAAFHLTSFALHLLCVALLFVVTHRLTHSVPGAVAAALLLGLHPVPAEAWVYISARADVVAGVLVVATLLAIERAGRTPSWA